MHIKRQAEINVLMNAYHDAQLESDFCHDIIVIANSVWAMII